MSDFAISVAGIEVDALLEGDRSSKDASRARPTVSGMMTADSPPDERMFQVAQESHHHKRGRATRELYICVEPSVLVTVTYLIQEMT